MRPPIVDALAQLAATHARAAREDLAKRGDALRKMIALVRR